MTDSRSRGHTARTTHRVRRILEYRAFAPVMWLFRYLPPAASYALASALGFLWYALDAERRRVALSNLLTAFGEEKTASEIERIARASFQNVCLTFAEFCQLMSMSPAAVQSMVETEGYDNFLRSKAKNRGVILLTAHLGNWELMALFQSVHDAPINVLGRPLDNALLNETLDRVRKRFGNCVIPKQRAAREIMRVIRKGGVIGILMDQNTVETEGVFVDFFGKSACTTPAIPLLAQRLNVPTVPAFTHRIRRGKHAVVVGEEVALESTGDRRRDLVTNTEKLTKIIEFHIRQHPEQWLWMHKRWKTRPDQASSHRTNALAYATAELVVGVPGEGNKT